MKKTLKKLFTALNFRMVQKWVTVGTIELIGNIASDPEQDLTPKGKRFACFRFAVDTNTKHGTCFIDVRLYGDSASWCIGQTRDGKQHPVTLSKGDRIHIKGDYRKGPWTKADGSVELRHQVSTLQTNQIKLAEPAKDLRDWSKLPMRQR